MQKKSAAGRCAGKYILVILKQRIAGIRQAVCRVDLPGLQGHGERIPIRDAQHGHAVKARRPVPVGFVPDKLEPFVCHERLRDIGARAGYDALL